MHPIHFDADYQVERNRLTVFFRLVLAIPWIIVVAVWSMVAFLAAVISWFAMMFTGRHPAGIYEFIAGFIRFSTRASAWMMLVTDEWPGFTPKEEPSYPVKVSVDGPQQSYSRAKTFFKLILYFPQMLIGYGLGLVLQGAWFIVWWRVLFTGKQSVTMHEALKVSLAYQARSMGFLLLLTETHPRILDLPAQNYPADAPSLPVGPQAAAQMPDATPPPPAAPEPPGLPTA